ncbi:MAG TPA: RNB domain-containing ribonuclease [Candidatus Eisenbacteria bacterium]|nr:RNB domain-containing ribonuclease [Candidatus Eisenbacteria bacterium]
MARPSHFSPDNILRFLQLRNSAVTLEDLSRSLQVKKSARRALLQMLGKLKKRGLVEEISQNRFVLRKAPRPEHGSVPKPARPPAAPQAEKFPQHKATARDEIHGRLVLHQDGYGFVVPDVAIPNLDGDLFIPRDFVEDAMHGDHVAAKITRLSGLPGARRAEGRILRIVSRAHPSVVGLFRYTARGCAVAPYEARIQHDIELAPGDELSAKLREQLVPAEKEHPGKRVRLPHISKLDGAVVNAELLRYGREGSAPVGRVIEILGRPGDLGVDTEIIIRKHHLPHTFPAEVAEEAEALAKPVTESDLAGREDFRGFPIVTIDGETARDFDDAVYVERREDGGWLLQVHIADVAHYVTPESPLDREARLRGNSVYFIDRAVPMLPEALSNGMCSLKPREERLVLSAIMDFDASGRMVSAWMTPGVIRSAERMTYTNVNKVLEGEPAMSERYAHLNHHFRAMKGLALLLNARRAANGSVDFDLPEPVIEFDEQQEMTNIGRSERNIAHRLIEEFMLAANRAVAHYLLQRGLHTLHRVHEKPDARKVLEFEEIAHAFGYSLGVENLYQREIAVRHGKVPSPAKAGRPETRGHGRERAMRAVLPGAEIKITPQHYQRLVQKLSGKPEERILSYLMLRSLKQARYSAESLGHFALGFEEYTHFTSPIRRYPDLVVHRTLKWALMNPEATPPAHLKPAIGTPAAVYSLKHLEEIAAETSDTERRAAGAERELVSWKTAQFMEKHLGDEYEALIISVQKYGCFVELFEVFVEGLLPITALEEAADTRCVYRERDHAIVAVVGGESGGRRAGRRKATTQLSWKLGDRVHVRAERIDPIRRRVEFALAGSGQ